MTATSPSPVDALIPCLNLALGYGRMLAEDIPAPRFCEQPHPEMNHPAFCYGHLSIYPNRVLTLVGREDLSVDQAAFETLFKAGVDCAADDGRYPGKDEIMAHYVERHETVARILPDLDPALFGRENPAEGRFKAMAPTIGSAVDFLMNGHHMCHLGQVSAWRRAAGLGSAGI